MMTAIVVRLAVSKAKDLKVRGDGPNNLQLTLANCSAPTES